jgi:hypothetical protein
MSESHGACEKDLGSAGNAFYNSLWEQAAAQGITVILSSGDGGSAGCDDFNSQQVATQGLAVSGFASTPFNVSVGGTDFDQVNNWTAYWNPTNDPTGTSAKSYIPEVPWNENCAQIGLTGCGATAPNGSVNIVAGSGGPSSVYGKAKWQMGVMGMPNDNHRDQPDISLFASPGFDGTGYVYCQSDQTISGAPACDLNATSGILDFGIVGGTSASAPAFAGIHQYVIIVDVSARLPRLPAAALAFADSDPVGEEGASPFMCARQVVLLTPAKSSHPGQLLSRQQSAPVSPLAATLTSLPASVANKNLWHS